MISFCLLATAMLGQVVTTDPGWFGRWIRGGDAAAAPTGTAAIVEPPSAPGVPGPQSNE